MIMFPMPTNNTSGSLSNKGYLSMVIVLNFLILISFCFMYYLFTKDTFKGSFWEWSWDNDYFLEEEKTNAGLAWMFFWMPLFVIDGLFIIVILIEWVESKLFKN